MTRTVPALPTCAPWCTALHEQQDQPCQHSIADITSRRDDIRIDLIRLNGIDTVQVSITDKELLAMNPDYATRTIRLDPMAAGVLGDLVRRLSLFDWDFSAAMVQAMEVVYDEVCGFRWCVVDHAVAGNPPNEHQSDPVGVGGVEVTRLLLQKPADELDAALVRLRYEVGGRERVEDLTPQEAADRAEFLDMLVDVDEMAAALRAAATDLGTTQ